MRISSEIETTRAMAVEPVEDRVSAGGPRGEDKRPRTVLLVTTSTSIVLILRHTGTFPRPEYIEEVDLAPRVVYKETESEYLLPSSKRAPAKYEIRRWLCSQHSRCSRRFTIDACVHRRYQS